MDLIALSVILQFFAPYWNFLGLRFLDDVAGKLIPLMEAVLSHSRYLSESGENVKATTDSMDVLKVSRAGIIDDTERKGKGRTRQIKRRVDEALMKEPMKKDMVAKQRRIKARSAFSVYRSLQLLSNLKMPTIPGMVRIASYKDEVLLHLDDDSVGIIAIRGIGGIGKTTLLNEVNYCFLPGSGRISEFDHVISAVASRGCTLEKLQKGIAESLGLDLEAYALPPATVLFEYLKSKNFLLLLDDLWRDFKLEDVGIPRPGTGGNRYKRKVIFTTRLQDVCDKMTVDAEIKMNCLGKTDALDLIKFHAGAYVSDDLAEDVVVECRGLPLALKTVGWAIKRNRWLYDDTYWRRKIELLKNCKHAEIQEMEILQEEEGEETDMFRILKLSYDALPDDALRQCFLSCCLWPEDYAIDKGEFIDCCMGLGLIDESNQHRFWDVYRITILEEAYLMEPGDGKETVRVHDVIRDLALWIASDCGRKKNKWLVQAGVGLKEAIDVKQKWIEAEAEAVEIISLMGNYIEMLPQGLPACPSLRVLMLQMNSSLGLIPPDLFQCMPALTFLDLSQTILEELPKEISILVQLQYLNLSQTCIKELPQELARLKELKYLLLRYTFDLRRIPRGVISNLSKLQRLDLFGTNYKGWEVKGSRDCGNEENTESLQELEELNSKVMLPTRLGTTVEGAPTLQMLSRLSHIFTRYLCMKCMCSSTSIQLTPSIVKDQLGSLKMLGELKKLMIKSCQSLVELEVDGEDLKWQLPCLEDLVLRNLQELKVVKWRRVSIQNFLPFLRSVTIDCCYELENADWVLQLPFLQVLMIVFCPKMRHVIDDSVGKHVCHDSAPAVNQLQKLFLHELRSLTSICDQAIRFPSLEIIDIEDCDELKQLPAGIMWRNLREIRGSERWWQSLQWQHENMRASLHPLFRRKY